MSYYSYAPNTGMQYHPTSAEAKATAERALRQFVHNGITGPDISDITWGEVMDRGVPGQAPILQKQVRIDYERSHPQVMAGRMENGNGDLVRVENIHETDLMYHELVLTIALIWKALSGKIARFKRYNFEEVTACLALLFEKHGVERGGRDGNMQFFTYDRRYKLQIGIQKCIDFGPELQVAQAKLLQSVDEMGGDKAPDLRTMVTATFGLDEGGKIKVSKILSLRSYKFDSPLWKEGMEIISNAIIVVGSKKMLRLYERNEAGEYIAIPLDIAAL
jgi:hypothetical protein